MKGGHGTCERCCCSAVPPTPGPGDSVRAHGLGWDPQAGAPGAQRFGDQLAPPVEDTGGMEGPPWSPTAREDAARPPAGPAGTPPVRGEGLAGKAGEEASGGWGGGGYVRDGPPGDPPPLSPGGKLTCFPVFWAGGPSPSLIGSCMPVRSLLCARPWGGKRAQGRQGAGYTPAWTRVSLVSGLEGTPWCTGFSSAPVPSSPAASRRSGGGRT